ncbi:cysteine synthase A [Trichococcus ilyis]|jgi:cysteine synthase A|uniref:Cysteine synthase n=1 Tax=Trichococcus ilyis TaxID=640938 RepID=A0A143Z244_9LACT|nr:cysteine synthase A [Trichococcus ilyis]CZR03486.1 cysteine synthase/cystathionine beta-synthase pyridoxal-phosphate attachment site [Trichococcus ilyis]SEJ43211.1 cysteine synthase [Trichococcus ilyis]
MVKVVSSIANLIGDTPIIKLNKVVPEGVADVYVKLESFNAGGSVKDRIALNMIEVAEEEGLLKPGYTIVEPTSGNTGVGLAMLAAAKGYKAIFVMPDTMSMERRLLLAAYGAELVLTPGAEGMNGSIAKAREIAAQPEHFMPMQFDNPANPAVHEATTGPEIIEAFEGKTPDAFIAGVGTGGTVTGVGKALRKVNPNVEIYALEPTDSAVLSGKPKGPHKIQGIGAGFIPTVLDTTLYNGIIQVSNEQAFEMARRVAREEGILVGISGGAAIAGAIEVAIRLGKGKSVVTVAPDNGERYLSTPLFSAE